MYTVRLFLSTPFRALILSSGPSPPHFAASSPSGQHPASITPQTAPGLRTSACSPCSSVSATRHIDMSLSSAATNSLFSNARTPTAQTRPDHQTVKQALSRHTHVSPAVLQGFIAGRQPHGDHLTLRPMRQGNSADGVAPCCPFP